MKPSITEIAKELNLSAATISRVLNKSPKVSPETRKAVQNAIQHHGYIPRVMRNRRAHIGFVIIEKEPRIQVYKGDILSGILAYTTRNHLSFSMLSFPPVPMQRMDIFKELRERGCDIGILACKGYTLPDNIFQDSCPILLLDDSCDTADSNYISFDYRQSTKDAVEHLLEFGHRHIVFAGIIPGANAQLQLQVIKDCYNEKSLDPSLIIPLDNLGLYPAEASGEAMGNFIFEKHPKTTAIITAADNFAYGIMYAARLHGRKIPNDLSIISCSDFSSSIYMDPPLSVIRQPRFTMGERTAKIAHKLVDGIITSPVHEYIATEFINRGTTARVTL